ncbi:MAG: hypothetical protein EHM91_13435, partial [Planctomycetota bacterium]
MSGMGWTSIHESWRSIDEDLPAAADAPARQNKPFVLSRSYFAWLSNAPWWLLSAGAHVVLLLGAALVYVERSMAVDEGALEVLVSAARPSMEIERTADLFERKGVPKDDRAELDQPAIFFPEAKDADRNESADNEDYRQMKGESQNFLSFTSGEAGGMRGRQPSRSTGAVDSMGVGSGGGGGGRFGGRFGGRENLVARGGGGSGTEDAVRSALRWLARHQAADGAWGSASFSLQCPKDSTCSGSGARDYDVGATALSLLAFLGAGYSHLSRDETPDPVIPGRRHRFGEVVRGAIKWLLAQQDPDGCFGPRRGNYMYNHSIAALAISEAFGMTNGSMLVGPAQKGIEFLAAAQNPGKGWRYRERSGDNDTSVTGWAVMPLKSAEISGLPFPKECYDGARSWLDQVTEGTYGRAGYTRSPANGRDRWLSPTAIAIMSRIFMDKDRSDPRLSTGCDQLLKNKPRRQDGSIDYYYWYYASLALFQFDGPTGAKWRAWNDDMKSALVPHQNKL